MDGWLIGWMDGWMDGSMFGCMYVSMYACMHVRHLGRTATNLPQREVGLKPQDATLGRHTSFSDASGGPGGRALRNDRL